MELNRLLCEREYKNDKERNKDGLSNTVAQ